MNPVSFSNTSAMESGAKPNPKLESAAHEFEASLMKEFLKPLQEDSLFSAEDNSAGSQDTLMGYGAEAMAKGISEHGGFGIASQILRHFYDSQKVDENSHRIGSGHPL
jgi:Rod binding domain-containing protein